MELVVGLTLTHGSSFHPGLLSYSVHDKSHLLLIHNPVASPRMWVGTKLTINVHWTHTDGPISIWAVLGFSRCCYMLVVAHLRYKDYWTEKSYNGKRLWYQLSFICPNNNSIRLRNSCACVWEKGESLGTTLPPIDAGQELLAVAVLQKPWLKPHPDGKPMRDEVQYCSGRYLI